MDRHRKDVQLTPDELKFTPNTAREMRFGPDGKARPRTLPPSEEKDAGRQPVNLRKVRNRTETIFSVIFAGVAIAMVGGALYLLIPESADEPAPKVEAPADDAQEDADDGRELQGGVKVRKGFQD